MEKVDDLKQKVLDIMSLIGYPVGKIEIDYNCHNGNVKLTVIKRLKNEDADIIFRYKL